MIAIRRTPPWPVLTLLAFVLPSAPRAQEPFEIPRELRDNAARLAERALDSGLALEIAASLTTEIGPRLAGSEQEARAREWGVRTLEALGFADPRVQTFEIDYWTRGELDAEITAPFPQDLVATALGGSAASPPEGLEAEIVFFDSYDDLAAAATATATATATTSATATARDGVVAGRIVYVNDRMVRAQTGAGYGPANRKRQRGWIHAERLGAAALVIRSVGTSNDRFAHTGMMSLPAELERPRIAALAVSNPDADQIERMAAAGGAVRMRLRSTAGFRGRRESGNVIAELPGADLAEQIVLIGAHLDSWDQGTGAVDDAAGVAVVTAAAKLIAELPEPPRRTIRIVYFGAEEVGLRGALHYAEANAEDVPRHVIATESDFGAGRVWRFASGVSRDVDAAMDAVARELMAYGVVPGGRDVRSGGPDITPLADAGVPTVRFEQSGEDYFDLHHTPNDTLDKIDPAALAQNVAVWAAGIYLLANLDVEYRFSEAP
jgi:Zn-dependent M28 family amino/carboxypeptidase